MWLLELDDGMELQQTGHVLVSGGRTGVWDDDDDVDDGGGGSDDREDDGGG